MNWNPVASAADFAERKNAGFSVLPSYAAYHVPYISDDARQQILLDCERKLLNLDALEALSFPNMGDFDERLYPKT